MHTVISIDPSLRSTGVTLLTLDPDTKKFKVQLQTLKSTSDDERMQTIANQFRTIHKLCRDNEVVFGVVEGYAFAAEGNARTQMAEVGAACRLGLAVNGIPFVELPPRKWKSVALKSGAASKKEIREKVALLSNPAEFMDEIDRPLRDDEVTLLTSTRKRPINKIMRLFLKRLPKKGWSSPDEMDSGMMLVALLTTIVQAPDYLKAQVADPLIDELRDEVLNTLKAFKLLK